VAGPLIGLGAIDAAQKRGVYFIGVDTDWATSAPEYAPILLTSVEKRMDVSVVAAVKAVVDGTFSGGTHVGTLATDEVGLSPFHDLDAVVPPRVKSELEEIKAEIIAGKIKTKP
jgi:basic membrane protein A